MMTDGCKRVEKNYNEGAERIPSPFNDGILNFLEKDMRI